MNEALSRWYMGLQRTELAELVGVDEQTIGRQEKRAGKKAPFRETVRKVEGFWEANKVKQYLS